MKEKILIVHNYYQIPGGEDTVVANEKKLLEDHGHEVILYSRNNSELKTMTKTRKVLLPFTTVFSLKTYREVKRIIKEQHIEIVHVHNTLNLISPSVYYAAFSCKVPVVQTIHNFRLLCPGATFYRDGHICEDCVEHGLGCAVKHSCYRGSKLQTLMCVITTKIHRMLGTYGKLNYICLTEFNKQKLLKLNRPGKKRIIDPARVYVKPNFTFEAVECGGVLENEYFLFIGRVERIKGLDILLSAFSAMPDQKLVIAGNGPLLNEYKAKATNNVEFVGYLKKPELTKMLNNAKAVIVSSQLYEGFPMAIVEAFAAHKPVIAGDIGNVGILVKSKYDGLKFQYNSAKALAGAVREFNDMDAKSMGENAYREYCERLTPESNYRLLTNIYKNISE